MTLHKGIRMTQEDRELSKAQPFSQHKQPVSDRIAGILVVRG